MSSAKYWPICVGANELKLIFDKFIQDLISREMWSVQYCWDSRQNLQAIWF